MIYVSTACVKTRDLDQAIRTLHEAGFTKIECSGGTSYRDDIANLLQEWLDRGVSFLLHNYFPPAPHPFVLNLASEDKAIARQSVDLVRRALKLSRLLNASRYAVHAGYLVEPQESELGHPMGIKRVRTREVGLQHFHENLAKCVQEAERLSVDLYIENNVLSSANYNEFHQINPFLFTDSSEVESIAGGFDCKPLVDFGHLYVSCKSLGLDFASEAQKLCQQTDYYHVSDNDGTADQNRGLLPGSPIQKVLQHLDLSGKIITLEIYDGLPSLQNTFDWLTQRTG